jgi:Arm domain-containing DNA-binding protein
VDFSTLLRIANGLPSARNEGHFKKRGTAWYFWVELEPGPDGKRRQKSRGGFKTRNDAERVVLPAPFGPTKPVSRPGLAAKEHSSSADRVPNRLLTPSNSSTAAPPPKG